MMLASAEKLQRVGADFVICPDNTIHQALPYIEARSPLPWLHIAACVADEADARGFRRIAITGTKWLVESEVYPQKLTERSLGYMRPHLAEREEINRIIMDELVRGVFKPEAGRLFPEGDRPAEDRGLRRRRAGLHRDPADHERRQLAAADPRFDPPARPRRAQARDRRDAEGGAPCSHRRIVRFESDNGTPR